MNAPHGPVLPPTLARLLGAVGPAARERAWDAFVHEHSAIVLHTCRSLARDDDAVMDGYAHVLGALREDECRRLRSYAPDGRTRFTTWLVVIVRRLLVDHHRHRFGRSRSEDEAAREDRGARRRLAELVSEGIDPDELASSAADPDAEIRRLELQHALDLAIAELQPDVRLMLALRFEDERPIREIASIVGAPTVFHVYRRIDAALVRLRAAMARLGVHDSEP